MMRGRQRLPVSSLAAICLMILAVASVQPARAADRPDATWDAADLESGVSFSEPHAKSILKFGLFANHLRSAQEAQRPLLLSYRYALPSVSLEDWRQRQDKALDGFARTWARRGEGRPVSGEPERTSAMPSQRS